MREVDLLIRNGLVLTMNTAMEVHQGHDVVVDAHRIVDIQPTAKANSAYRPKRTIDATGCVVMPGLINTHAHSPLTLLRGACDDLPLMDWLQKFIWPVEKKLVTRDFVRTATRLAVYEMMMGGTTTFNDSYFFSGEVAQVAKELGIRCIAGEIILDFPTPSHKTPQEAISYARECMEQWSSDPLVSIGIAPHSPYACSPDVIQSACEAAASHDATMTIHLAESEAELRQIRARYDRTPVEHLAALGVLNNRTVAAHCVHLADSDIELLAKCRVGVAHDPEANMKLGNGVAPIAKLLARGVKVGIGTDGAASNNDLSLLNEIDFAAKMQKGFYGDATLMKSADAVRMLTIDGAQVLGLDDKIGSIEAGKQADIILLDMREPHMMPVYDVYSQITYCADAHDVRTVIVNGNVLVENRRCAGIDTDALRSEVDALAGQIAEHLNMPKPIRCC